MVLVFLAFPVLCLFLHTTSVRSSKWTHFALIILFVMIYSFSLNGSDIEGYRQHYVMVEKGASAAENGQETGYYYLMRWAVEHDMDYLTFRIMLLSVLSAFLFLLMRKLTDDLPLSLFFVSSMFVIYTISAYRQYIVIVLSIWWLYQYVRGKKVIAIIGTGVLLYFHVTAILPLGCMIYEFYRTEKRVIRSTEAIKRNFLFVILLAVSFRAIMTIVLKTGMVNAVMGSILGIHASADPTPLTFGLISRMLFLLIISYMYRMSETDNNMIRILYLYYSVSMLIYIAVPLEFAMGRLMNNAHILCAVLIPMLKKDMIYNAVNNKVKINIRTINQLIRVMEIAAIAILINQLMKQNGYAPYLNILLGNTIDDIQLLYE